MKSKFSIVLIVLFLGATIGCKVRNGARLSSESSDKGKLSNLEEGQLTATELQNYLKNFSSASDLISSLPSVMYSTSNYVLMRYSASECMDEVSPENPRVISFDRKSGLILSWIKESETDCGKSIRVIQRLKDYVPDDAANSMPFEFASIVEKQGKLEMVPERQECESCHQHSKIDALVPIWAPDGSRFPISFEEENWPGAFGGFERSIHAGMVGAKKIVELDEIKSFAAVKGKSSRYEKLMGNYSKLKKYEGEKGLTVGGMFLKNNEFEQYFVPTFDALANFDNFIDSQTAIFMRDKKRYPFINPRNSNSLNPLKKNKVSKLQ